MNIYIYVYICIYICMRVVVDFAHRDEPVITTAC